jgi:hypothetical protein
MRRLALATIVSALLGLGNARAPAQSFGTIGGPVTAAPLQYESSYVIPSYGAPRVIQGLYVPQYAYSRAPIPTRPGSIPGYGSNDFPFYGRPTARHGSPWSWSALSQYPAYPVRPTA